MKIYRTKSQIKRSAFMVYYMEMFKPAGIVIVLFAIVVLLHGCLCSCHCTPEACQAHDNFWGMSISDWIELTIFFATLAAVTATKLSSEMKSVTDLMDLYSSEEMHDLVKTLSEIDLPIEYTRHARTPEENAYNPCDAKNRPEFTNEQNIARRKLKMYYRKVWFLYTSGYIRINVLEYTARNSAFPLLFKVVEPMERMINKGYDDVFFHEMMELCSKQYAENADDFQS